MNDANGTTDTAADDTTAADTPEPTIEAATEPDDGLTFPGSVLLRFTNGSSIRHVFATRDEFEAWGETQTPEQHAQIVAIEQG